MVVTVTNSSETTMMRSLPLLLLALTAAPGFAGPVLTEPDKKLG